MTTEQQKFIAHNDSVIEKAKKTGKFTRLGSGQYYLYAQSTLYYVRKREFLSSQGWGVEWGWSVDGSSYDDAFGTLSECKSALKKHIEGGVNEFKILDVKK